MKKDETIDLSRDFYQYRLKVFALFEGDEDIEIGECDPKTGDFDIVCTNKMKYYVLQNAIIADPIGLSKPVHINVIYTGKEPLVLTEDVDALFEGNPHYAGLRDGDISVALFKNEVLFHYTDDISKDHGMKACLAEDLAREVLFTKARFATKYDY